MSGKTKRTFVDAGLVRVTVVGTVMFDGMFRAQVMHAYMLVIAAIVYADMMLFLKMKA